MNIQRTAFTLIELLIVVAVIGVLSSIAVPNFIDAQIKAKVARVRSDHKAIAAAIEIYRLDHGTVLMVDGAFAPSYFERLRPLTTPISYMNALPVDPFQPMESPFMFAEEDAGKWENQMYAYNRGDVENGASEVSGKLSFDFPWSLTGTGPDHRIKYPYYFYPRHFVMPEWYSYDPSNGIVSGGEIFYRSSNGS